MLHTQSSCVAPTISPIHGISVSMHEWMSTMYASLKSCRKPSTDFGGPERCGVPETNQVHRTRIQVAIQACIESLHTAPGSMLQVISDSICHCNKFNVKPWIWRQSWISRVSIQCPAVRRMPAPWRRARATLWHRMVTAAGAGWWRPRPLSKLWTCVEPKITQHWIKDRNIRPNFRMSTQITSTCH